MNLCDCPRGPTRNAAPKLLHCLRCAGWAPQGGLPSRERVDILAREAQSLLAKLAEDYAWARSISFAPQKPGNGQAPAHDDDEGDPIDYADPVGNVVANGRRLVVRAYSTVAARLLERVVHDLRLADEAIGDALLAAEPPGPADHTPAPYHDPATLFPGRPDLADAHAAKARRHTRGEGIPT
jgi:hypothetical protein